MVGEDHGDVGGVEGVLEVIGTGIEGPEVGEEV